MTAITQIVDRHLASLGGKSLIQAQTAIDILLDIRNLEQEMLEIAKNVLPEDLSEFVEQAQQDRKLPQTYAFDAWVNLGQELGGTGRTIVSNPSEDRPVMAHGWEAEPGHWNWQRATVEIQVHPPLTAG